MDIKYDIIKNKGLEELYEIIYSKPLTVCGTSIDYNLYLDIINYIIDGITWEDWENVLIVGESIINNIELKDALEKNANEKGWDFKYENKNKIKLYVDQTSLIEIVFFDKASFKYKHSENHYDFIFLDDIDQYLSLKTFSSLIYSSKKMLVKTIDRESSIVYKIDLKEFFYRMINDTSDIGEEDYYLHKMRIANFNKKN